MDSGGHFRCTQTYKRSSGSEVIVNNVYLDQTRFFLKNPFPSEGGGGEGSGKNNCGTYPGLGEYPKCDDANEKNCKFFLIFFKYQQFLAIWVLGRLFGNTLPNFRIFTYLAVVTVK
jgi:hypothetical protein